MDGNLSIIIDQIIVMFLVMAVGFALYRARFIDDRGAAQMSDLVLYVANPILIAQALMRDFDPKLLEGALWVACIAAVTIGIAMALGRVVYREGSPHMRIGRFSLAFSNAGFIGIPLAQAMAGSDGIFFISVANTVQTALMWTYGVLLVSGDRSQVSPRKIALNPALIAMAVGLVCFFASWHPPVLVERALDTLGNLNTGMVMLVLGAYLGQCRLGELIRDASMYKVCGLRLVVMPAVALAVLWGLEGLADISWSAQISALMYQAMPVAAVSSLFAHRFACDGAFATGAVALSTLFSLITLPLALFAASVLL